MNSQTFHTYITQFLKRKRRIRFAILMVFVGMLAASILITTTYTQLSIQSVIQVMSRDLIQKTQKTILADVSAYFHPAMSMTNLGKWVKKDTDRHILENPTLLNFLLGCLDHVPHSTLFHASDRQGNFISVAPLPGKRVFMYIPDKPLPHKSKYVLESIDRRHGYLEKRAYLDAHGHELACEFKVIKGKDDYYDPRERPWYQASQKKGSAMWSNVYADWFTKAFTVTASNPIYKEDGVFYGMIGCDISIKNISHLLSRQKASRSGINMILNAKGDVVSFPDYDKTVVIEYTTAPIHEKKVPYMRLAKLDELQEPNLVKAYSKYKDLGKAQFTYIFEDIEYIAYFSHFPKDFSQDWILGMVAPSDDFIGPIRETSRAVFLIALIIMVAAIIVLIVFSHKISYPIELLAQQMRRMKHLNLEEETPVHSSLKEISDMEHALIMLREGLSSFSKYVPKGLVKSLIASGVEAKLGGKRKNIPIMFTDIKDFTSLSEKMDSDALMTHLSSYLSTLSHIILMHKGTIDKYIGDAIMAFWGAPEDDDHSVNNACQAALVCSRRLLKLNETWVKEKKIPLITRFGLHYGDVIVGNVGSADRMNYTAIGDSVNLASRLEGINKVYGTQIIVSEPIYNLNHESYLYRPVDLVAVKGRQAGVKIYELVAKLSEDPELAATEQEKEICALTTQAFEAYLDRDFNQALSLYQKIQTLHKEDSVAALYIQRCKTYLTSPPPKDWDGIFHATKK